MRLPADELGNLLRAHGYLVVQRPPELWDVETSALEPFVRVMGELLAACLCGRGSWTDERWRPGAENRFVTEYLSPAFEAAGAVHAYSRRLAADSGSVTVLYRRWTR